MKQLPLEFSSKMFERSGLLDRMRDGEMLELVFDDQPLEAILYGQKGDAPTSATVFGRARELLAPVRDAHRARDVQGVVDRCTPLVADDLSIPAGLCFELVGIVSAIVPQYANPLLRFDFRPLLPLLEKIWAVALANDNETLLDRMATPFFRLYEHYGEFDKARQVLGWLLEKSRQHGDRFQEAISLNNHAFEFLLEGRFGEALSEFEQAANLFQSLGDSAETANAWANYWQCKFEISDLEAPDKAEAELKKLEKTLTRSRYSSHARKASIVLAKIAEKRGDLKEAIRRTKRAIAAAKGTGTRYPETDAEYLDHLTNQIGKTERRR